MDKNELEKKVDEILERGILIELLPTKDEFRKKLLSGEKLRFYIGADPTAKALHLGHAQNLMVLEDFRRLGHEVIFLIGDFTGMIGDPTDKGSARIKQTREDIEENFKNWKDQVKNILNFDDAENPVQIKYNSEWLGKLNFGDVLELASNFTVQQMLERDMFEKRLNEGRPIYVHEFMYPLMQGYDSVAMDVDVELCGTDQIFNALAGRTLMQKLKNKNKFVIATKLIADEKTGLLMSKSNGTGVFLDLDANNLFGAIMAQSDGMIKPLAIGCTRIPLDEIEEMMKMENPRDAKMRLAVEITKIYHGEEKAKEAHEYFINTFSKKELPVDIREASPKWVDAYNDYENITSFMVSCGLANSKSDARRKIEQGGVSIDGERVIVGERILNKEVDDEKILKVDRAEDLILTKDKFDGKILKVGKINFVKIVFES